MPATVSLTCNTCPGETSGMGLFDCHFFQIMRSNRRLFLTGSRTKTFLLCAAAALFANSGLAQNAVDAASTTVTESVSHREYGFQSGSFVVAPIPFKDPTLGAGLALGAGYLFQMDAHSDTSVLGFGAMRSDNGSLAYGATGSFAWNNNKWQLGATLGQADLNYDLYSGNLAFPVNQTGVLFKSSLLYGVTPELAFGGEFRYLDTIVSSGGGGGLPPIIGLDVDIEVVSLAFLTKWDTRDDSLFPKFGHLMDLQIMGAQTLSAANERRYSKAFVNFGLYRSLTDTTVLATQMSTCSASTNTPYFDKCSLGGTDAFRGFSATQYLDLRSLSAQIEIRQTLSNRFRGVVFAGAGMTGTDFGTLNAGGVHVAAGVGLRFKLSKKFDADFSVDVAYNDEDAKLVYIYVGQRF